MTMFASVRIMQNTDYRFVASGNLERFPRVRSSHGVSVCRKSCSSRLPFLIHIRPYLSRNLFLLFTACVY